MFERKGRGKLFFSKKVNCLKVSGRGREGFFLKLGVLRLDMVFGYF